jgi:hypothetical protein
MADLEMQKRWEAKMKNKQMNHEYKMQKIREQRSFAVALMIMVLLMVFGVIGAILYTHPRISKVATLENEKPSQEWRDELLQWLLDHPETDVVTSDPIDPPSDAEYRRMYVDIPRALLQVKEIDVDGDGKVNCVDFVIQFWMYYPNKNDIQVVWNKHPPTDWNHLYVNLYGIRVECGAALSRRWPKYELDDFWPNYNPLYDRYITEDMPKIIAGKYWNRGN